MKTRGYIILYDLVCPFKDICIYGSSCSLRGLKVVECDLYRLYEELEKRKILRAWIEKVKKCMEGA